VRSWLVEFRDLDLILHPGMAPDGTPLSEAPDELSSRIQMMDDSGVGLQILSLPPISTVLDEGDAITIARLANDAHSRMVREHPDRFLAYMSLPLPYLEPSLVELERGFDDLGLAGVMIQCSFGSTSVIDEQFDSLFEAMNRRGAVVLIHPSVTGLCTPLLTDFRLMPSIGPVLEDTVVIGQLLTRHFPQRFPDLKLIVPHLGGALPMCAQRLNNQLIRTWPDLPEPPLVTMKRLWYDTVTHGSTAALNCARDIFGIDRIVAGSDYPFLEHYGGYRSTFTYLQEAGLSTADCDAVLFGNAQALFGLHDR
jgi:predicted TIM-barrel fold metal-dependent hydrolase